MKLTAWRKAPGRKTAHPAGRPAGGKNLVVEALRRYRVRAVAYFNFEEQPDLKQFFENTRDVQRILQNLSLVNGQSILPEKTLIIPLFMADYTKRILSLA